MYENLLNPSNEPRHFETPQEFLRACVEYFQWAEDTPLLEEQLFSYMGAVTRADKQRPRVFTKKGLANRLGIPVSRLDRYKEREGFADAIEMVEQVISNQKFELAAANLLNATIISRDLGLADRSELSGPNGQPLQSVVQYQLPDNGRDPESGGAESLAEDSPPAGPGEVDD